MRPFLLLCLTLCAFGRSFTVAPQRVRQGETLTVQGRESAVSVRWNGRTITLYQQSDGESMALVPVRIEQKPGSYRLEYLDGSGTVRETLPVTVLNAHYPKQNLVLTKAIAELKSSPEEREMVAAFRGELSPVRYWQAPLQLPIPGCMTSLFGVQRYINGKPTGDIHAGIDQRGAAGTPIHAVAAGVVNVAGTYQLHGGTVGIDHGQGMESMYLHMSEVIAKIGDHVEKGDVIGLVGSTGRSTAPHLHWSLYVQGEPVNPLQWVHVGPCLTAKPQTHTKKRASTAAQ